MDFEIYTTEVFDTWFASLKDQSVKRKLLARFTRLMHGNFGDFKKIDVGLFELRFFFAGGLRVYYTRQDKRIILLLTGGDKSTQRKDILKAKSLLEDL